MDIRTRIKKMVSGEIDVDEYEKEYTDKIRKEAEKASTNTTKNSSNSSISLSTTSRNEREEQVRNQISASQAISRSKRLENRLTQEAKNLSSIYSLPTAKTKANLTEEDIEKYSARQGYIYGKKEGQKEEEQKKEVLPTYRDISSARPAELEANNIPIVSNRDPRLALQRKNAWEYDAEDYQNLAELNQVNQQKYADMIDELAKTNPIQSALLNTELTIAGGMAQPVIGINNAVNTLGSTITKGTEKLAQLTGNTELENKARELYEKRISEGQYAKSVGDFIPEGNQKIDNKLIREIGNVANVVGSQLMSAGIGSAAGVSGSSIQALGAGGSSSQDVLNENPDNILQAVTTGVAKGYISKKLEDLFDANILTEGAKKTSIQNKVTKWISKAFKSDKGKEIANRITGVAGENVEEFLEDNASYIIDKLINNKELPDFEEYWNNAYDTAKTTTLSTIVMQLLGFGGENFKSKESQLNSEVQFWTNETQKIIDNENLALSTINELQNDEQLSRLIDNSDTVRNSEIVNNIANNQETLYNNNESESGINGERQNGQRTSGILGELDTRLQQEEKSQQNKKYSRTEYEQWEQSIKPITNSELTREQQTIKQNDQRGVTGLSTRYEGRATNGTGYQNNNAKQNTRINLEDIKSQTAQKQVTQSVTNTADDSKMSKQNTINQKVSEYIKKNKDNFSTNINIDTDILNTPDNLVRNYASAKETVLYDKARKLFKGINKKVFKNNNQYIYVTNADISESIHKTMTNKEQKRLMKENIAVFSQLDKIIESGELISSDKTDNKGRKEYSDYEYYVSKANIDGQPYIVEFDTRLQVGTTGKPERHFRLERIYKIDETDSVSGTDNSMSHFVPESVSINNSISQNSSNMQVENKKTVPTINDNTLETGEYTKQKNENTRKRRHYDSIIKSEYASDEAKAIAKELMGTDTYVPESNNKQLANADEEIAIVGADNALKSLLAKEITGGTLKADDIAIGERLIQYYSKIGDKTNLRDAIQATAMAGTIAGQTVQALSLLNHQTPEGQAIWLQRSVDKMNNDLKKARGEKAQQFNLTSDMLDKITNSKNSEELQNNLNEVYQELGQQVSKTIMQKIDAWRYFAMLANFRTHIRNIVGNTAMGTTQSMKNKVAGSIEAVVQKINPNIERTHTVALASKDVKQFAKNDIKNVADRLGLNENKYNPKTRLENSMRTFKNDTMENTVGRLFDLNDKVLAAEDGWGLKAGYVKALSDYMTANKLTPENITDKQLAKARNYAVEQAKEATFHQESNLASLLNQLSKKNKFSKFLLDSTLPFKKTPINVAKAGLEYSPVGLVKSAIYDTAQLRKGNISVNKYIDNISKGLTGTGIALVGYALASCGILKASGSDDKDKEEFDQDRGSQTYSIKIGDATYSLDWLSPTGIPLFIGVETYEIMQASKQEKTSISSDEDTLYNQAIESAVNILDGFTNAMNPMTEMSMLSGLTSAIKSYDGDSAKMFANFGTNAVKSYVNQFVPTLLSQIARTTDEYERSTTSTKTGTLPKAIDSTKNYIISKIPGLRQTLPTKTDLWGNEVKQSDNIALRTLRNSLFPWTTKEISTTDVDNAILKVYDSTGESSVLPDRINKNITINSQKYVMTSQEYAKYAQQYGKTSYDLLNSLTKSKQYNKMSDTQKQKAIENVYTYAKEQIKIDYAKQNNLKYEDSTLSETVNAIKKVNGNMSNYFEYTALTQDMKKDSEKIKALSDYNFDTKTKSAIYENSIGKDDEKFQKLKNNNVTINDYLEYRSDIINSKEKKIASGELTEEQDLKNKDKINILLENNYSEKVTSAIYENYILSDSDTEYPIIKETFTNDGLNIKKYLKYKTQEFTSDKKDDGTLNGKVVSGSKKNKVEKYLNSMDITYMQRLLLYAMNGYSTTSTQKSTLANYIKNLKGITDEQRLEVFDKIGFTVYKDGTIEW